jgi:hypothetical protein
MAIGSKHGVHRDEWEQRRTEFCARGQDLPQSKLIDLDVLAIRSAKRQRESLLKHIRENLSNAALASQLGVHERSIEKIMSRETWTHI